MPAELRNRIYRDVLLEDEVTVDDNSHLQPGLLRACRQLRNEATRIYYEEKAFILRVFDLRLSIPSHHWLMVDVPRVPMPRMRLLVGGAMHWDNLVEWMKRLHGEPTPCPAVGPEVISRVRAVSRALAIVFELRQVPWGTVLRALEHFKEAVEPTDGSWTWT